MIEILSQSPLLTLFIVVALGAIIGSIPFGRIKFGAAGALFVGLALSSVDPSLGDNMAIVQSLGLSLFVYTVGVGAGAAFFSQLRQQLPLMTLAAGCAVIAAGATLLLTRLLDIPKELATGLYTGALTAAPALDAATRIAGNESPSVGYAFGYPIGVFVGIVAVSMIAGRAWTGEKDTPSLAGLGISATTVKVSERISLRSIPEWKRQDVRVSYLHRGRTTRVALPGEDLEKDDEVVIVGLPQAVDDVAARIGSVMPNHLADDRSDIDFERLVVSNPDIASRTIAELNLPAHYGAIITRVRRGDLDLLARDDFALQIGDRVAVVVPREHLNEMQELFGDSERRVSEIDALGLGMGLVLGMLLGLVSFPMPGGESFSLGPAAGPLIVGMMLGALRKTGPLNWTLPEAANLTIRQLGLLLFLAGLGLTAGPKFAGVLASPMAWRAGLLALLVAAIACVGMVVGGRWIAKLSAPRTAGGVAGFLGQPAVLEAAAAKVADERVESAYAALFAFSIVVKIVLVPLVWNL
ncbi:MAG: TrkA C-terminal domain-containing protein [Ancrocorticia sp.]